ncbi:MAG TPA: dTDP-4-dehydrorhamnose reductase [Vicinamibacterales bacterium]|nr:dTDP-4-dehydrorhamnose reductase [Vicinamibacterales bacterium]
MNTARNDREEHASVERPVLVLGAAGQLGQTVAASFEREWHTVGLTRRDLDVTDAAAVYQRVSQLRPWAIVNCAAYNDVDRAEEEPVAAMAANALAVLTLARAAREASAVLVHYGSDFVFDGETNRPYREDDAVAPQSVYAGSKLLGEWFAEQAPVHYVLRVESLFGGAGPHKSSLDRIVEAIANRAAVRVFVDRVVSPSFAPDVAAATASLLRRRPEPGLYHCVNSGATTWHELASYVRNKLDSDAVLEPVTMTDVQLAAKRPRYCALSNDKLRGAGINMPAWQDALDRYLTVRPATSAELKG